MISEFFLNIIFKLVTGFLNLLPDINFTVESSAFEYFLGIVQVAAYMLPMGTVMMIIDLIIILTLLRIVIAVIKSIWDLLPLV